MYSQIQQIIDNYKPIHHDISTFFTRIGRIQSYSEKWIRFYYSFQIFNTLTQNDLMTLTGFSRGSVSGLVRSFLGQNLLIRQRIKGSHTFYYCLADNSLNFKYPYQKIIEKSQRLITGLKEMLVSLQKEYPINQWQVIYERMAEYLNFLIKRKERMMTEWQDFSSLMMKNTNTPGGTYNGTNGKKEKAYPFFIFPTRNAEDERIPMDLNYSSTMIAVEGQLRVFIEQNNIFNVEEPLKRRILASLILREYHTQETLSHLLGVSLSSISRNLKSLIDLKYAEEHDVLWKGKKVYRMTSINPPPKPYYSSFNTIIQTWKEKFSSHLLQLSSSDINHHMKEGFSYYYTILNRILLQNS